MFTDSDICDALKVTASRLSKSSAHRSYQSSVGPDGHLKGYLGELAFSRVFGLAPPDPEILGGRVDFTIDGKNFDVKTNDKALWTSDYDFNRRTDVFVLVTIEGAKATIRGWSTPFAAKLFKKNYKDCHVVPAESLFAPADLWTVAPSLKKDAS